MKFVKFRIHNYKAIIDSGDCYLSEKLTILAGKNESGKTSILEALEDCHEDNTIRDTAKPIEGGEDPYIDLFFEFTKADIDQIFKKANIEIVASEGTIIGVRKQFGEKAYQLIDNGNISFDEAETWEDILPQIRTLLGSMELINEIDEATNQDPEEYKEVLTSALTINVHDEADISKIKDAIKCIDNYKTNIPQSQRFLEEFIKTRFPYFILFSSFEDTFPDSIQVSKLAEDPWAQDLEVVSNFRISEISVSDHQRQRGHLQKVNAEFTERFKEYWTQDSISLSIDRNGDIVNFWIDEGGVPYKPSQRSQGQKWYLSFYVKVLARSREDIPNVILIDEPGLYLHAKAQKDLLNVLDQHFSNFPIIFSTHSPYLINDTNLENIRLVEKHNKKTAILGKIHAKADKDTLTPILTAIGLGLNDSIADLDQKTNIVVEGPEDIFYLQAFKILLPDNMISKFKANFIHGGGAGNMGIVGSILDGWGCDVFYLYDNDQGKKDGEACLKKTWAVLPDKIRAVTTAENSTVADILSKADFKKYVLNDDTLTFKSKNSEYIKKNGKDKVLLARLFLQKVKNDEIALDSESNANIRALFETLDFFARH